MECGLHYLDNFHILGPPHSVACQSALSTSLATCEDLGFPITPEKIEGLAICLVFLGIEIDTIDNQLCLPQEKLETLLVTVNQWMGRGKGHAPCSSAKKRELLSLIGMLSYAASVVRPGRAFLRSLIDASTTVQDLEHWVHLNAMTRADIAWWHAFLQSWNSVSLLPSNAPPLILTSDASGSWGCGAVYLNAWFQWPQEWAQVPIAPKELVPIVMAMALWGPQWTGSVVCCRCDNAAVVATINKGSARDPALTRLLRILALLCAVLNVTVTARHLPGAENTSADALSRNHLRLFSVLNLQASPIPAIIPKELLELVFNKSLLWTSPDWMGLFSATLVAALRLPLAQPISQPNDATSPSASNLESSPPTP